MSVQSKKNAGSVHEYFPKVLKKKNEFEEKKVHARKPQQDNEK